MDSAGNLYVSDAANAVVDEVPAASGTNWGQTMTADDLYIVAGGGTTAPSTSDPEDGEAATSVELANEGIAVDSSGDLLVADNTQVGEVVAPTTSSGSVTTPSGWTLQSSESSGATTTDVYTRELVSSDSGVTLDYSAAAPKVASVAVYRGVDPTSPIDVSSVGADFVGDERRCCLAEHDQPRRRARLHWRRDRPGDLADLGRPERDGLGDDDQHLGGLRPDRRRSGARARGLDRLHLR